MRSDYLCGAYASCGILHTMRRMPLGNSVTYNCDSISPNNGESMNEEMPELDRKTRLPAVTSGDVTEASQALTSLKPQRPD
jgi:hypothetical protein